MGDMAVLIGVRPSAGEGAAVGTVIISEGTSTCIDVMFVANEVGECYNGWV